MGVDRMNFGEREQIAADVKAFHGEAWQIAVDYEGEGIGSVTVSDRAPYAKVLHADGMHIDIMRPKDGPFKSRQAHVRFDEDRYLDLGGAFDDLVEEGVLEAAKVDAIKQELRSMIGEALELSLVVFDDMAGISRPSELRDLSEISGTDFAEHFQRIAAARQELASMGAVDVPAAGSLGGLVEPYVLPMQVQANGYRVVARMPNSEKPSHKVDFPLQGLASDNEKGAGAIHSMEGENSNIVRAVMLEAVKRRLEKCLAA